MADLKIAKLPDRKWTTITFRAWPELTVALDQYAQLYGQTYGQSEPVPELIPFMLEALLKSDKAFLRANRLATGAGAAPPPSSPSPPRET